MKITDEEQIQVEYVDIKSIDTTDNLIEIVAVINSLIQKQLDFHFAINELGRMVHELRIENLENSKIDRLELEIKELKDCIADQDSIIIDLQNKVSSDGG